MGWGEGRGGGTDRSTELGERIWLVEGAQPGC